MCENVSGRWGFIPLCFKAKEEKQREGIRLFSWLPFLCMYNIPAPEQYLGKKGYREKHYVVCKNWICYRFGMYCRIWRLSAPLFTVGSWGRSRTCLRHSSKWFYITVLALKISTEIILKTVAQGQKSGSTSCVWLWLIFVYFARFNNKIKSFRWVKWTWQGFTGWCCISMNHLVYRVLCLPLVDVD